MNQQKAMLPAPENEKSPRKSTMLVGEVYFWTATVKDWKLLLKPDKYKKLIISSLEDLYRRNKIRIYGFVIMPNHIHLIWEMLEKNGKEMPYASFNKYVSHQILLDLKKNHPAVIPYFEVNEPERRHRFWQRDSLAIHLDSREKMEQKLDYIHLNPLQDRWRLAERPEHYPWSSASFYEGGNNSFPFIHDYRERF